MAVGLVTSKVPSNIHLYRGSHFLSDQGPPTSLLLRISIAYVYNTYFKRQIGYCSLLWLQPLCYINKSGASAAENSNDRGPWVLAAA